MHSNPSIWDFNGCVNLRELVGVHKDRSDRSGKPNQNKTSFQVHFSYPEYQSHNCPDCAPREITPPINVNQNLPIRTNEILLKFYASQN
jgi:hypothetical protein